MTLPSTITHHYTPLRTSRLLTYATGSSGNISNSLDADMPRFQQTTQKMKCIQVLAFISALAAVFMGVWHTLEELNTKNSTLGWQQLTDRHESIEIKLRLTFQLSSNFK